MKMFFDDEYMGFVNWSDAAAPAFKRALHVVPVIEEDE